MSFASPWVYRSVMRYWLTILFLLPVLSGWTQKTVDYVEEIENYEQFEYLQGRPVTNKFGQVSALKIVYRLEDEKLFYIHSSKYDFHINFCEEFLGYYKGSFAFNLENYTETKNRDYYLATINHYSGKDFYTLEFSVADQITLEQIEDLHRRIKKSFHVTDTIRLFLNTSSIEERYEKSGSTLPTITVNEIYANQQYQALKTGGTYGRLKYYEVGSANPPTLWPEDIVILKGTPNELPPVSGVISNTFQTPLSHISILCQNRGTPFMASKDAWINADMKKLEGTMVRLKVDHDNYEIIAANEDSAKLFFEHRRANRPNHELAREEAKDTLVRLEDLNYDRIKEVGAKAANFGELARALKKKGTKAKVPESAFAIPFTHYLKHLEASGAQKFVIQLLSIDEVHRDSQVILLDTIRQLIRSHPLDTNLESSVKHLIIELGSYRRMRFRSSTNAEDIEGFNGAGLYSSATGIVDDTVKTIDNAIRKVWASVWNERAFFERQYFGIDHSNVAMGILAHRSFPNESANGVAITKNIYRPSYLGFILNVQTGEVPVVNPPPGVVCDQLICYSDSENTFYNPKRIIEYISRSSETKGEYVLSKEEIVTVTKELSKVKKHFYRKVNKNWLNYQYQDFGLDLEFKIDGKNRTIYIKQVRPYND